MLLAQGVSRQKKSELHLGRFVLNYSDKTLVMGILNPTPDSFYEGGKHENKNDAVNAAYRMVHEGADIIDIGGQSTRPGSNPVTTEKELARILPIIEEIAGKIDVPISIDTSNHVVAEESLKSGAVLINDITGLKGDEKMAGVVSKYGAGVVLMHIKGTPKDMQDDPAYDNLIEEIISYLRDSVRIGANAGISHEKMIIDPGIGFGKTEEHNFSIINRLSEFKQLGKPILIGVSRKSFIGNTLKLTVDERIFGTAACVALSIANGANIVRVHDVKQMKEIARMTDAIAREGRL